MSPTFSQLSMKNICVNSLADLLISTGCKVPKKDLHHFISGNTTSQESYQDNATPTFYDDLCIVCGGSCPLTNNMYASNHDGTNQSEIEHISSDQEKFTVLCSALQINDEDIPVAKKRKENETTVNDDVTLCKRCEMRMASIIALEELTKYLKSENVKNVQMLREQCINAEGRLRASGYSQNKFACSIREKINEENQNKEQAVAKNGPTATPAVSAAPKPSTSKAEAANPCRKSTRLKSAPFYYSNPISAQFKRKYKQTKGRTKPAPKLVADKVEIRKINKATQVSIITSEIAIATQRILNKEEPQIVLLNGATNVKKESMQESLVTPFEHHVESSTNGEAMQQEQEGFLEPPGTSTECKKYEKNIEGAIQHQVEQETKEQQQDEVILESDDDAVKSEHKNQMSL